MTTLAVQNVHKYFGGLRAIDGVSLSVASGEILGIIGQNGAGKTTLFNTIAGTVLPSSGRITIDGDDVTNLPAWRRSRRGIGRTFQIPQPIWSLSVRENVEVGLVAHGRSKTEAADMAGECLSQLGLAALMEADVNGLSPGQLRILELARAAALAPLVLLLDEVFAGLTQAEQRATSDVVLGIKKQGVAIVWIEHHVRLMMELADRIVVMDHGKIIAEGAPRDIARDDRVISAYLGAKAAKGSA